MILDISSSFITSKVILLCNAVNVFNTLSPTLSVAHVECSARHSEPLYCVLALQCPALKA